MQAGVPIAAFDVGSNSIHMVIVQVSEDGQFRVIDRAKEMVRLGQDLPTGMLSVARMDAGVRTLDAFWMLAQRRGVERYTAVATSAVREATNGGDFIRRVKREVGLRIKVIPGHEEARLIYQGVRHAIDMRTEPTVIVDIGGGSVECVLVEHGEIIAVHSVKLGVARLTEQFLSSDPPSRDELSALNACIAMQLVPVFADLPSHWQHPRVIGTSGTMLNLISIAGHLSGAAPTKPLHQFTVPPAGIMQAQDLVIQCDRKRRRAIKGLDGKRTDLIVAGACVAAAIVERMQPQAVVACSWSLREGVVFDYIERHSTGIAEMQRYADPRRRSTARLIRRFGRPGLHNEHVAFLATRLLYQVGPVLELAGDAMEWIEFAALLHDIGHHISHKNHHLHTYYLILHGELLGFESEAVRVIALVARYHRKGTPRDADADVALLLPAYQSTVRALAAVLRIADALDRSHYSIVQDVTVEMTPEQLRIRLHTNGEAAELEVWEAQRRCGLLAELLDRSVDFSVS